MEFGFKRPMEDRNFEIVGDEDRGLGFDEPGVVQMPVFDCLVRAFLGKKIDVGSE